MLQRNNPYGKGMWKILKKILFPLMVISESVLFFFVLLLILLYNLTNLFNLIYVDMPYEEPVSLVPTLSNPLFIVLGLGLIIFIYIRFVIGNQVYEYIKKVIWGGLLGLNLLWCIFWLFVGGFNYSKNDWILLIVITLFSFILLIQIIVMLLNGRKMKAKRKPI